MPNTFAKLEEVDALVVKGGGVKGIAYVGALRRLFEAIPPTQIRRCGGTSAGAIFCALMAIGYTPDELESTLDSLPFQAFKDSSIGVIRDSYRFLHKGGWYKGDKLHEWLRECIKEKTGNPDLTYQQLHELAEKDPTFRDLYTVATNTSREAVEIFSHESRFADLPIALGVRASMAIPFYFCPVVINGEEFCDGGIMCNYPEWIFDEDVGVSSNFKRIYVNLRKEKAEDDERNPTEKPAGFFTKLVNDVVDFISAIWGGLVYLYDALFGQKKLISNGNDLGLQEPILYVEAVKDGVALPPILCAHRARSDVVTQPRSAMDGVNKKVLGFCLESSEEIGQISGIIPPVHDVSGFSDRVNRILSCGLKAQELTFERETHHRTVLIDNCGVDTTDFHVSEEKITALLKAGYAGLDDFITLSEENRAQVKAQGEKDKPKKKEAGHWWYPSFLSRSKTHKQKKDAAPSAVKSEAQDMDGDVVREEAKSTSKRKTVTA
ncbi:MAG: patatin-like phospholipase family protein [Pseudomonadota bacterium]